MPSKNKKKKTFCHCIENLSKPSMHLLKIGFSIFILAFICYTYHLSVALKENALWARHYYGGVLEYLLMSLLLVVMGAIAFDLVEKYIVKKK